MKLPDSWDMEAESRNGKLSRLYVTIPMADGSKGEIGFPASMEQAAHLVADAPRLIFLLQQVDHWLKAGYDTPFPKDLEREIGNQLQELTDMISPRLLKMRHQAKE